MSGTGSWEAPGAVLSGTCEVWPTLRIYTEYMRFFLGFDWHLLPKGSIVVDVGGGIGSTSMLLASAFSSAEGGLGLKFVIQDRPVVVEMGEKVCGYSSSVDLQFNNVDSLKGLEGEKSRVSRFWDRRIPRSVLLLAPLFSS